MNMEDGTGNHPPYGRHGTYQGRGRQGRGRFPSRGGRWNTGRSHHNGNSRGGRSRSNPRNDSRGGSRQYDNSRSWGEGTVEHEELPENTPIGAGGILRIAVQGCCHGQLDQIYKAISEEETRTGIKVDLLLCCGDFQSLRNTADFHSLAVPDKYKEIGTFHKYYSGEVTAPVLTIFIGGNHEASLPLQELFYGGWVAPNIYYLGCAGVVNFGGVRIAGLSGIYKEHDYKLGHYERPPYQRDTLRSVYHVRNVEVYRLQQLTGSVDIMLSHDWPRGIERFGNTEGLLRKKQFFRAEVEQNCLGSPAGEMLLHALRPKRWFAAHLHVKFEATVNYRDQQQGAIVNSTPLNDVPRRKGTSEDGQSQGGVTQPDVKSGLESTEFIGLESETCCEASSTLTQQMTKFLALDKCLPKRHFLHIVAVPRPESEAGKVPVLKYDLEWLAILRKTAHLTIGTKTRVHIPDEPVGITALDKTEVLQRIQSLNAQGETTEHQTSTSCLPVPRNFMVTVPPHDQVVSQAHRGMTGRMVGNPQTDQFLNMLGIPHVVTVPYKSYQVPMETAVVVPGSAIAPEAEHDRPGIDDDEIDLDKTDEEEDIVHSNLVETLRDINPSVEKYDDDEIDIDDDVSNDDDPETKKHRTGSLD